MISGSEHGEKGTRVVMKSLAVIAALVVAAPNVVFAENQATQTGAYFGIGLGSQGQKMSSPGLAAEAT